MATWLRDRSRVHALLLAIALSVTIMLAFPLFGNAQQLNTAPAVSAQSTATASSAAEATVHIDTTSTTGEGASNADVVLVGTFTSTIVLVLAGLALLDRKPSIEEGRLPDADRPELSDFR